MRLLLGIGCVLLWGCGGSAALARDPPQSPSLEATIAVPKAPPPHPPPPTTATSQPTTGKTLSAPLTATVVTLACVAVVAAQLAGVPASSVSASNISLALALDTPSTNVAEGGRTPRLRFSTAAYQTLQPRFFLAFFQALAAIGSLQTDSLPRIFRDLARAIAFANANTGLYGALSGNARSGSVPRSSRVGVITGDTQGAVDQLREVTLALSLLLLPVVVALMLQHRYHKTHRHPSTRMQRRVRELQRAVVAVLVVGQYGGLSAGLLVLWEGVGGVGDTVLALLLVGVFGVFLPALAVFQFLVAHTRGRVILHRKTSLTTYRSVSKQLMRQQIVYVPLVGGMRRGRGWYALLNIFRQLLLATFIVCLSGTPGGQCTAVLAMYAVLFLCCVFAQPHAGGTWSPNRLFDGFTQLTVLAVCGFALHARTHALSGSTFEVAGYALYSVVLGVSCVRAVLSLAFLAQAARDWARRTAATLALSRRQSRMGWRDRGRGSPSQRPASAFYDAFARELLQRLGGVGVDQPAPAHHPITGKPIAPGRGVTSGSQDTLVVGGGAQSFRMSSWGSLPGHRSVDLNGSASDIVAPAARSKSVTAIKQGAAKASEMLDRLENDQAAWERPWEERQAYISHKQAERVGRAFPVFVLVDQARGSLSRARRAGGDAVLGRTHSLPAGDDARPAAELERKPSWLNEAKVQAKPEADAEPVAGLRRTSSAPVRHTSRSPSVSSGEPDVLPDLFFIGTPPLPRAPDDAANGNEHDLP